MPRYFINEDERMLVMIGDDDLIYPFQELNEVEYETEEEEKVEEPAPRRGGAGGKVAGGGGDKVKRN